MPYFYVNPREAPEAAPRHVTLSPQSLLTPAQLAQEIKVSASTLAKLRMTGAGPRYIKRGRTVLYQWSDVLQYIDGLRRNSTSDHG